MDFSPIVLFVYNRPIHTKKTLESLANNKEIKDSDLIIYCDGAKSGATELDLKDIAETRYICKSFSAAKSVRVIEREKNIGLARNILEGVTETVNKNGKIIVLEDDLELSSGFLGYMNSALDYYKNNDDVMHISGYWFPTPNTKNLPENYFLSLGSCWGWATWKRAWDLVETDPVLLKEKIQKKDPSFTKFNLKGTSSFLSQLNRNIDGSLMTWAIKWYSSIFLNDGLSLHPNQSYVNNIGHDGSGENCGVNNKYYWEELNKAPFKAPIRVEYCQKAEMDLIKFYSKERNMKFYIKEFLKKFISFQKRQKIKNKLKRIRSYLRFRKYKKLWRKERFVPGIVEFKGKNLHYVDGASLFFMLKEIFDTEIYKIKMSEECPYILDCGANIGLAAAYLAKEFPKSEIICFEPDQKVLKALKSNISAFGIEKNVEVVEKGLWSEETILEFYSEGADGGRVKAVGDDKNIVKIDVTKLSKYINKKVDFLKIDIEGSEFEVLKEITPHLDKVERIFLEYHSFVGQEQCLPEILEILKNAGFRLNINSPGLKSQSPLHSINTYNNMDMQLNIYGQKL